jgi:hypothetical protein
VLIVDFIISAGRWMLQGLAGIVKGTFYIEGPNYWITTSASTWGWIHLVGGASVTRPDSVSLPERRGRAGSGS